MSTLGEEFPKQQTRVRTILGHYKELGSVGFFGAHWIEDLLQRADLVVMSGDAAEMIGIYQELKDVQ